MAATALVATGCHVAPQGTTATVAMSAGEREYRRPGPPVRHSPDHFVTIDDTRPAVGTGPLTRYTVETERALVPQLAALQSHVILALDDQKRGWATTHRLRQVGDPDRAQIRILLARPATVDRLCAAAGYVTNGRLSCWNGRFALLNLWRWRNGSPGFRTLTQYRRYLINHEFGHGLGLGHEGCPGLGRRAPLMMQQSKGLLGCRANPLPYPASRVSAVARSVG